MLNKIISKFRGANRGYMFRFSCFLLFAGMKKPTVKYQKKQNDYVTISWSVVPEATQYNIQLFASNENLVQEMTMLSRAPTLYCQFSNLSPGTQYTVTVIATSEYGVTSQQSVELPTSTKLLCF